MATKAPAGATPCPEPRFAGTAGTGSGREPSEVRPGPGWLGWPHPGSSPEAAFWGKAEGTTGAELDAPFGLQPETSQLCLRSGSEEGRPGFSPGVKKNCRNWRNGKRWTPRRRRPSFLRMRRVSAFTLAWGGVGPREARDFVFQPQASTANDLICLVGWPLCWERKGSYEQTGETGRDS